jgi:hypothetical protein
MLQKSFCVGFHPKNAHFLPSFLFPIPDNILDYKLKPNFSLSQRKDRVRA